MRKAGRSQTRLLECEADIDPQFDFPESSSERSQEWLRYKKAIALPD